MLARKLPWILFWFRLDRGSPRVLASKVPDYAIGVDEAGRAWVLTEGLYEGPYPSLIALLDSRRLTPADIRRAGPPER